jgi:GNAT superfamily N-acetyltransferase
VAVVDDRFVGLVSGYEPEDDPGCVHLVQMWTAPEIRRRGLGRRLVEVVVDFAGSRPVRLAVIRGNDGARLLFETLGFVPDDRPPLPGDPCTEELHYIRRG